MSDAVVASSYLQLFEEKPIYKSFVRTTDVYIPPNPGWKDGSRMIFRVPVYENLLYESDSFQLHTVLSMKNGDDSDIDDQTQVYGPLNGIGLLLMEYITVEIGSVVISGENRSQTYSNYLSLLFGHSAEDKNTWLAETCIFFQDTAGQFNNVQSGDAQKNTGFKRRYGIFAGKNKVRTSSKIVYPLGQAKKLLIPGIDMRFIMKRNDDKFLILTNTPAKNMQLVVDDIWITAKARSLEPAFYNSLVSKLQTTDARYNFIRSAMFGPTQLIQEVLKHSYKIFEGTCPMSVLLFFVDCDNYNGSYSLNPLEMSFCKVKSAYLEIEGRKYPGTPYSFSKFSQDVNQSQMRWPYLEMYRILQQQNGVNCGLTFSDWLNGYTFWAFQISEVLPSDAYQQESEKGITMLNFEFEEKPDKPVFMFCLGTFQSHVLISATNELDQKIKPTYCGTFALDNLLYSGIDFIDFSTQNTLIFNTKPSTHPGLHWLLLYVSPEKVVFFDSFAKAPSWYSNQVSEFLFGISRNTKLEEAPFRLQGDSRTCGLYCIFVAHHLVGGQRLDHIVNSFSQRNLAQNDSEVITWFTNQDYGYLLKQKCKSQKNPCISYEELQSHGGAGNYR